MDHYLVEFYLPRREEATLAQAAMRARVAAEQLTNEGKNVRYLRTIFVPNEEICLHVYESQAEDFVGEASLRAEIAYERITRAVTVDGTESARSPGGARARNRDGSRRPYQQAPKEEQ